MSLGQLLYYSDREEQAVTQTMATEDQAEMHMEALRRLAKKEPERVGKFDLWHDVMPEISKIRRERNA